MDGNARRSVTSGAGAFALVLLAVVGWWLFSGNGPQGPGGNDPRYAVPDVDVTAGPEPATSPRPPRAGAISIDSYVVQDDLRLALNYRTDATCADAIGTPRVIESDVSVTITLSADSAVAGSPCGDPVERHTLGVLLDSPLDGRAVLDGSRSPQVRVEPTSVAYE